MLQELSVLYVASIHHEAGEPAATGVQMLSSSPELYPAAHTGLQAQHDLRCRPSPGPSLRQRSYDGCTLLGNIQNLD